MVQGLGVCLPIQGPRVRSLVPEDPTCHRASKPVLHSYWRQALEPRSARREIPAMRSSPIATREESPLAATPETLTAAMKT